MKQVKYLLVAFIALCLTTSVHAQTKKTKKAKTTMHAHSAQYQCPMKCEGDKTYAKAGKCPVCNMNLKAMSNEVTSANYQCPMKCEGDKTYSSEGKCPVCNMNMKKVKSKGASKEKEHTHNHS